MTLSMNEISKTSSRKIFGHHETFGITKSDSEKSDHTIVFETTGFREAKLNFFASEVIYQMITKRNDWFGFSKDIFTFTKEKEINEKWGEFYLQMSISFQKSWISFWFRNDCRVIFLMATVWPRHNAKISNEQDVYCLLRTFTVKVSETLSVFVTFVHCSKETFT
jgi:hypothetical protein